MLAYLIGSTPYSQIILFALIQATLTFFAIWFVASLTAKVNSLLTASTGLVTLIWLALSAGEPFVLILNSAYHYGAFLSAIFLVALWIKFNNEDQSKKKNATFFAHGSNYLCHHAIRQSILSSIYCAIYCSSNFDCNSGARFFIQKQDPSNTSSNLQSSWVDILQVGCGKSNPLPYSFRNR